jgi:hypothetical protein
MHSRMIGAAAAVLLFAAGAASATTVHFSTALKGADEVPANTTKGKGQVKATLDSKTKVFSYTVTYSGLTGPAVAAHFHGPADAGANAPPIIAMAKLPSPIKGSETLTDDQVKDLTGGKWYFNVHTSANPGGEIRGQLKATP